MDNEQHKHNKLTNTDFQLILFNFLSLHGDAIFDIFYKKHLYYSLYLSLISTSYESLIVH